MREQFIVAKSRADLILSWILLGVLALLFCAAVVVISLHQGLASADDGFFALVAKSLTNGKYGLPMSSDHVSLFNPSIGSGPVLIGLGALATFMLGPQDSLGLLTLFVFFLQFALAAILLSRQFSGRSVLAYSIVSLFLLIVVSRHQWYFGNFMGEVPAFGFVLLGTVLLASGESRGGLIVAGIFFALAYLTKQISLFAVFGIIVAWALHHAANSGLNKTLTRLSLVLGALAGPVLIFESIKLLALGLRGYIDLAVLTLSETENMAIGRVSDRGSRFLETVSASYGPVWVVSTVIAAFALHLAFLWHKKKIPKIPILPLMLWAGALAYGLYMGFVSTLWPRYFWIGAAITATACATTVLYFALRARWLAIGILLIAFGHQTQARVYGLVEWSVAHDLSSERSRVLAELASREMPIVGRSWHSFYDVLYLLPQGRTWLTEAGLSRYQNRDFIAILNAAFTDRGHFFQAVTEGCQPVFGGDRYSLYTCGRDFWGVYIDTGSVS